MMKSAISLRKVLTGGDPRTLKGTKATIQWVGNQPGRFLRLMRLAADAKLIVAMRAADAAEKISRTHPALIASYAAMLLELAASPSAAVRWHVAQMLPRTDLSPDERRRAVTLLLGWARGRDESPFVRTAALESLMQLAQRSPRLSKHLFRLLLSLQHSPSAAVRARSRKLLKGLAEGEPNRKNQ